MWNSIASFSWYAKMDGHVKQHIKESCNVGGRKLIEIYHVVFVVIVTIPIFLLRIIIIIYNGGKDIGRYLTDERTVVLVSSPSALNAICQTLRVNSPL